MTKSELQRVYIFPIYPRDSEITHNKGIVNADNGQLVGTHWTCFYKKGNK